MPRTPQLCRALLTWTSILAFALSSFACEGSPTPLRSDVGELASQAAVGEQQRDHELEACAARLEALRARPGMPGAPDLQRARAEVLGRAKGEPVMFVAEPQPTPDEALTDPARATRKAMAGSKPAERVRLALRRHFRDYPTLRGLLLREGYVYSADPEEALALVKYLELPKLFGEPSIWLMRASRWHRLERSNGRAPEYRHVDGPLAGATAEILWGDRVTADRSALTPPMHRDLASLADELGFDRAKIVHLQTDVMALELRFGAEWVTALLAADGPVLSLGCLAEPKEVRDRVDRFRAEQGPHLRSLGALHQAVTAMVVERLPFDRPRDAKDHLTDGQLRPQWLWAYRRGSFGFSHEGDGYLVFDGEGRPAPPQMCVDFVLDSFERASGTWFEPRGKKPARVVGRLDFDALGIGNRAGVLAFGTFAEAHPEAFEFRRLPDEQRIPFGERQRFFASLLEHADDYAAGDIVAIQGVKRDGNIHQHAILIERTDPMTGFPCGLADQMKWPRRRTWEGIMAEAPRRSLLFHVRLRPATFHRLDPEATAETREQG